VVEHAGDDDNVYFVGTAQELDLVQLDTAPGGQPPLVLEAEARFETADVNEAVRIASSRLGTTYAKAEDQPAG
jgi:hypothetical protein